MAGFRLDLFKGIRPRVSKRKLPAGEAQTAENVKFSSGDLEPWQENVVEQATTDTYNNKTIFLYENDDSPVWFEFSSYVDVARGPLKGDPLERVYYTGDGVPKMTYNSLQTSAPYPSLSYDLGIPKPASALTASGQALPEDVDPDLRRTSTDPSERPSTYSFEIVNAEFTVYPGSGTTTDVWRYNTAALGDITLQVDVGDTFRVLNVLDDDTVTIGSNTGTGAVAATLANDKTSVNYWQPMDEQGTAGQEADFIGWRIPDGMVLTIPGHLLRIGDVIRITRLDKSFGFNFSASLVTDFYELELDGTAGDWGVPDFDSDAGVYRHENVKLGAADDGQTLFELGGGFYYDVDRASSTNSTLEDRTYVYTYVSSLGEEGPPSDPSTLVTSLDGDTVTLTGFNTSPPGIRDITHIRIYRTNATAIGTEYQFVREVTLSSVIMSGSVTDAVAAAGLGEIIESTTWFGPDPDMQGITTMPNGMMVGFKDKNIYFCEPFLPHAWPPEYDQAVDYDVIGLAPFGNSVAVLTDGTPYIITGSHPRNANIRPYKINQACVSKESIATANDKVYYASPDGLVEIGVNGARIATEPYAKKEEWQLFDPTTMVGEFHDGRYYGFFDGPDNVPQAPASVSATGTIFTSTLEADLVAGGKTIILTLTSETWVADGGTFDAVRQNIIDEITGTGAEPNGWNNERSNITLVSVVRTSDTVVTITLPVLSDYSIIAAETLSFAAPAVATTSTVRLVAPETALIGADDTYSSQAIITATASAVDGTSLLRYSDENIDNWIFVSNPSTLTTSDAADLSGAAYHQSLDRWAVCGTYGAGTNVGDALLFTNDGLAPGFWTLRSLHATSNGRAANDVIYEPIIDAFYLGGEGGLLQYSFDGINWERGFLPAALAGFNITKFARAPWGNFGAAPRVYAIFGGTAAPRAASSASLSGLPPTQTWIDLGAEVTSGGSGTEFTAITAGNRRVYVADDDATAEVGYFTQGGGLYTTIGDLGMDCVDLAYGGGRLVAISADGRIQYVDVSGDAELTIGNWSAVSSAIDTGKDLARLSYDEGDGVNAGYGFIALLSDSGTPDLMEVYTSPDAITWTSRAFGGSDLDGNGIGVAYPESNLDTIP